MGLLEGYFVPLHHFHPTPSTFDEKVASKRQSRFLLVTNVLCCDLQVHNVNLAFDLMLDAGLAKPKARAEGT